MVIPVKLALCIYMCTITPSEDEFAWSTGKQ